ncbi:MAG TPA: hypothetical protein VG963_02320, partial [Polyangiaceae bacterium]|nr:hypothetical protein [Polyangiaceae bacterium]
LTGGCLPRQLTPDAQGLVPCNVYELLPAGVTSCSAAQGLVGRAVTRTVSNGSGTESRLTCLMQQVPVQNGAPRAGKVGWYYDDLSAAVKSQCSAGDQQRIAFSFGNLPSGAGALFECLQPVASTDPNSTGLDAVGVRCDGSSNVCAAHDDGSYTLVCIQNTCQIQCRTNTDCPASWQCAVSADVPGTSYCQQPSCPQQDSSANAEGS